MKTRILSKDRIFDTDFGERTFKMIQLLLDSQMAQNQNDKKNLLIFVPLSFFWGEFAMFRVYYRLLTSISGLFC